MYDTTASQQMAAYAQGIFIVLNNTMPQGGFDTFSTENLIFHISFV